MQVRFITAVGVLCEIVDGWKKQRYDDPHYLEQLEKTGYKQLAVGEEDVISF